MRELEDNCKVNIRFMYLMDHQTPSYRTFGYFINEILQDKIENIFNDINHAFAHDFSHLFIHNRYKKGDAKKLNRVFSHPLFSRSNISEKGKHLYISRSAVQGKGARE